jgi:hypothetical protein
MFSFLLSQQLAAFVWGGAGCLGWGGVKVLICWGCLDIVSGLWKARFRGRGSDHQLLIHVPRGFLVEV